MRARIIGNDTGRQAIALYPGTAGEYYQAYEECRAGARRGTSRDRPERFVITSDSQRDSWGLHDSEPNGRTRHKGAENALERLLTSRVEDRADWIAAVEGLEEIGTCNRAPEAAPRQDTAESSGAKPKLPARKEETGQQETARAPGKAPPKRTEPGSPRNRQRDGRDPGTRDQES